MNYAYNTLSCRGKLDIFLLAFELKNSFRTGLNELIEKVVDDRMMARHNRIADISVFLFVTDCGANIAA